jgi:hypothetical protein
MANPIFRDELSNGQNAVGECCYLRLDIDAAVHKRREHSLEYRRRKAQFLLLLLLALFTRTKPKMI